MRASALGLLLIHVLSWPPLLHAAEPQNIPVEQLGKAYQLVGKLHAPLGEIVHVEGIVVEGPFKGFEGGPNLRAQRIQGQATQQDIQIPLRPYFTDWGKEAYGGGHQSLPKLEMGKTYEMEGYETGGYVSVPGKAYANAGFAIQTTGEYFRTELVVYEAKVIEPLRFTPADFEGRRALMQGTAHTRDRQSVMEGDGWSVLVVPKAAWPEHVEGKLIETYGSCSPDASLNRLDVKQKQFALVDGTWRLVRLEDQLARTVALRGRARSLNGVWWFHYRGTDIYVENMADLPGWTSDNHWRPMIIRGMLDKAKLPRLDQVSLKLDRDLKEYYIVRNASWEPLPELLGVERPIDDQDREAFQGD
jgi:hypothetical protein